MTTKLNTSHFTVEQAVAASHMGVFFNVGQCCCAGTRIYVQGTELCSMSIHISYLLYQTTYTIATYTIATP